MKKEEMLLSWGTPCRFLKTRKINYRTGRFLFVFLYCVKYNKIHLHFFYINKKRIQFLSESLIFPFCKRASEWNIKKRRETIRNSHLLTLQLLSIAFLEDYMTLNAYNNTWKMFFVQSSRCPFPKKYNQNWINKLRTL